MTWENSNKSLPDSFFQHEGPDSFGEFLEWLQSQPYITPNGRASSTALAPIILALGIAIQELDSIVFGESDTRKTEIKLKDWDSLSKEVEALQEVYSSTTPDVEQDPRYKPLILLLQFLILNFTSVDFNPSDILIHKGETKAK